MLTEPREAPPRSSTYAVPAPGALDLTTVYQHDPAPVYTHAIYAVHGEALTYCIAPPGHPRPDRFATDKGDGRTLVTLRRVRTIVTIE